MKACAFVVGPDDGRSAALRLLARQLGFDAVYPYSDIADAERQSASTPLIFFLFAAVDSLRKLKRVADAVRGSESQRVRFSPMIYFAETPSIEIIKACMNMGFDDVIARPFTESRVEARVERQIYRTVVYYETPGYFGPDRRGRIAQEDGASNRGSGGPHRRLEIVRDPTIGINIVRDDMHVMV